MTEVESSLQLLLITAFSSILKMPQKNPSNSTPITEIHFFSCFVVSVFVCAIALRHCQKALRTWLSCALKVEPSYEASRSFYGSAWVTLFRTITHLHTRHTKTATGVTACRNFKWKDWWPQPCQCVRMVWNSVAGSGRRGWVCAHSLHSETQRQTLSVHLSLSPSCSDTAVCQTVHSQLVIFMLRNTNGLFMWIMSD